MTEAVCSPWSPLSLSLEALFDFLEGTEEETRTSSLVNPSTDHPFAEGGGWLLFTSPLSIPITLKLSINLTVERFTRRGKRHRAPAISWSQMSRGEGGERRVLVENSPR